VVTGVFDENVKETELHAFMHWKRPRTILSRYVQHTESEMSDKVLNTLMSDTGKRLCPTCSSLTPTIV
jgi:hypothetical protein